MRRDKKSTAIQWIAEKWAKSKSFSLPYDDYCNRGRDNHPVINLTVTMGRPHDDENDWPEPIRHTFEWCPGASGPDLELGRNDFEVFSSMDEIEAALPGFSEWLISEAEYYLQDDRISMFEKCMDDWQKGEYEISHSGVGDDRIVTLNFDSMGVDCTGDGVPSLEPFKFRRVDGELTLVDPAPWIELSFLEKGLPGIKQIIFEEMTVKAA